MIEFSSKLASTPICRLSGTLLEFRCYLISSNETLEGPKGAKTHHQIILDTVQALMSVVIRGLEVSIPPLPPMPKHFLIQVQILNRLEDRHQHQKFIREKEVVMETIVIVIQIED